MYFDTIHVETIARDFENVFWETKLVRSNFSKTVNSTGDTFESLQLELGEGHNVEWLKYGRPILGEGGLTKGKESLGRIICLVHPAANELETGFIDNWHGGSLAT